MGNFACGGERFDTKLQEYFMLKVEDGATLPDPESAKPLDPEAWKPFPDFDISAAGDAGENASSLAKWCASVITDGGVGPHPLVGADGVSFDTAVVQKIFDKWGKVRTFIRIDLNVTAEQWGKLELKDVAREFETKVRPVQNQSLGITYSDSCVVDEVEIGSAGMDAGLGPGMTILSVGGADVSDGAALKEALTAAEGAGEEFGIRVRDRSEVRIIGVNDDIGDDGALKDTLERNKGEIRCYEVAGSPVFTQEDVKRAVDDAGSGQFAVFTDPGVTKHLGTPQLELFTMGEYKSGEEARQRLRDFVASRDSAVAWAPVAPRTQPVMDWLRDARSVGLRIRVSNDDKKVCSVEYAVRDDSVTFECEDGSTLTLEMGDLDAKAEYAALSGQADGSIDGLARNAAALSFSKWIRVSKTHEKNKERAAWEKVSAVAVNCELPASPTASPR